MSYREEAYVRSLAEWGEPIKLPRSGGWLIRRPIPDTPLFDAMGPYPLFTCRDWTGLAADLSGLTGVVSVVLVADPFGDSGVLPGAFPEHFKSYKEHFVVELDRPGLSFVHENHRRNIRKASQSVTSEFRSPTPELLATWIDLYANLVKRHDIRGLQAFSAASFRQQFETPGLVVEAAVANGDIVGMVLWIVEGDRSYYHLGAYDDRGYALKASYALFAAAIEHFRSARTRWLNLGAGAGTYGDTTDGLTRFKKGWATETRTAHLCGRIIDRAAYESLAAGKTDAPFFPAYRWTS